MRVVAGQGGFTIIELVVVMVIIGILSMVAMPAMVGFFDTAKTSRAAADIRAVEKDLTSYFLDNNVYPDSLNDIGRAGILDPWKRPYVYVNLKNSGPPRQSMFFTDLNSDYDLYSLGKDGSSAQVISDPASQDDVVRTSDGGWVGKGELY